MKPRRPPALSGSRAAAAQAIATAAEQFPDLDPSHIDLDQLDPRDLRLALIIHRTVLQRWLTLEHLLDRFSRQPMHRVEPALRAVLLTGAAQLLFLQRLPAHAVVDEAVKLARKTVRPGAAGLVNAVLRRISEVVSAEVTSQPWQPDARHIPTEAGYIPLTQPLLPDPAADLARYLAIATSHPVPLLHRWEEHFGQAQMLAVALRSLVHPPTIVAHEPGAVLPPDQALPHTEPNFAVWQGDHTALREFLSQHPARRVQDPTSAAALSLAADLSPKLIVDFCAGRGTKTRQLATMFPAAEIFAADPHPARVHDLRALAESLPNVHVVESNQLLQSLVGRRVDLILLDVPCSNTGVLARRPEARYRFQRTSLDSLIGLQRRIIDDATRLIPSPDHNTRILYTTCSIELQENHAQARRLTEKRGWHLEKERFELPTAQSPNSHHDGGYATLLQPK